LDHKKDVNLTKEFQSFKEKIEILQQRVTQLENQTKNFIHAFGGQNKAPEDTKSIQQDDSTLERKKVANLTHSKSDDLLPY